MKIDLDPEVQAKLVALARASNMTPEEFARDLLRQRLLPTVWQRPTKDEFERFLREVGTPCGVSLTDEDLSRETMYD